MPDIKEKVLQAMRDLPPLPTAVHKLLAVMRDESSSAGDVNRVISSDQALAGKILKLVNSSYYGMSGEISTVTRAVVVLGFSGVRNVAMGFGMVSAMKKLGGTSMAAFWDHALAAGAGAQALAEQMGPQHDPDEAFIAGLMHDIGHIVLASAAPDEWRTAQDAAAAGGDIILLEKDSMGMSHAGVGERLMTFWQLPENLQASARWHHNVKTICGREHPLATLVALGDVLACIHGGKFERPLEEEHLARMLRLHCLEMDQIRAALSHMDKKIEEMKVFLKVADEGGEAEASAVDSDAATAAVVLSTDEDRVAWVSALLEHFGCRIYPLKAYFNREPGHEEVQLVVLDPSSLTQQQLQKMLPFLDSMSAVSCVLRDSGESPLADKLAETYPVLPYVFSRADVLAAVNSSAAV